MKPYTLGYDVASPPHPRTISYWACLFDAMDHVCPLFAQEHRSWLASRTPSTYSLTSFCAGIESVVLGLEALAAYTRFMWSHRVSAELDSDKNALIARLYSPSYLCYDVCDLSKPLCYEVLRDTKLRIPGCYHGVGGFPCVDFSSLNTNQLLDAIQRCSPKSGTVFHGICRYTERHATDELPEDQVQLLTLENVEALNYISAKQRLAYKTAMRKDAMKSIQAKSRGDRTARKKLAKIRAERRREAIEAATAAKREAKAGASAARKEQRANAAAARKEERAQRAAAKQQDKVNRAQAKMLIAQHLASAQTAGEDVASLVAASATPSRARASKAAAKQPKPSQPTVQELNSALPSDFDPRLREFLEKATAAFKTYGTLKPRGKAKAKAKTTARSKRRGKKRPSVGASESAANEQVDAGHSSGLGDPGEVITDGATPGRGRGARRGRGRGGRRKGNGAAGGRRKGNGAARGSRGKGLGNDTTPASGENGNACEDATDDIQIPAPPPLGRSTNAKDDCVGISAAAGRAKHPLLRSSLDIGLNQLEENGYYARAWLIDTSRLNMRQTRRRWYITSIRRTLVDRLGIDHKEVDELADQLMTICMHHATFPTTSWEDIMVADSDVLIMDHLATTTRQAEANEIVPQEEVEEPEPDACNKDDIANLQDLAD